MLMNANIKKTTVSLDGFHSLDISVNEENRTVVAELVVCGEEPEFIYAESFEVPCNYLRTAIKKAITYIGTGGDLQAAKDKKKNRNDWLNAYASDVIM